jgi:hypothetical protein
VGLSKLTRRGGIIAWEVGNFWAASLVFFFFYSLEVKFWPFCRFFVVVLLDIIWCIQAYFLTCDNLS